MNFLKSFGATIRPKRKEKGRLILLKELLFVETFVYNLLGLGWVTVMDMDFWCLELVPSQKSVLPHGAATWHVSASQPSQNSFQSHPQRSVDHCFEDYTVVSITLYKNLARKHSGWIIFQYKRIAVQRGIKERLSVMSSVSGGSFEN